MDPIYEAYIEEVKVQDLAKKSVNSANRASINLSLKAQIKKRDELKKKDPSNSRISSLDKSIARTREKLKKYK